MPALLALIIPALVPAVMDGVRALINKFTGGEGAKPANVTEAIALMAAETEKLKAVAALDAPAGNLSTWVADLRGSFRYIAAGCIILGTMAAVFVPGTDTVVVDAMIQMTGSVFAFMFGDRLYLSIKRK